MTGTIITWFETRKYGFVQPDSLGKEIFVHLTDIVGGAPLPKNTRVSYKTTLFNGRLKAINVSPMTDSPATVATPTTEVRQ